MKNAIHVCALSRLAETVETTGSRFIVTAINPWSIPATPLTVPDENHLKLAINDIDMPHPDLVHPQPHHIEQLVSFAKRWNRNGPLVIHCLAGISRSSASAYITACALNPGVDESAIARALRRASKAARPNLLMIRLADEYLTRKGRMIAAIDGLAPSDSALEAGTYHIPSHY